MLIKLLLIRMEHTPLGKKSILIGVKEHDQYIIVADDLTKKEDKLGLSWVKLSQRWG